MEPEYARNVIKMLETEKRGHFGKEALSKIKDDLFKEPEKALDAAYDRICLHFNSLPAAAKFLEIVQEEGRKIKMAEAKRNEEEHERQKPKRGESTFLTREQKTEYGQRSALIMKMITPRTESGAPLPLDRDRREKIVEACELMEQCYPQVADEWRELKMSVIKGAGSATTQEGAQGEAGLLESGEETQGYGIVG